MKDEKEWTRESMVEVELPTTDDFLKIKETLERIGVADFKTKTLYQTCHILCKREKYYIVHYKELFALDGTLLEDITDEDITRRAQIIDLLQQWSLLSVVDDIDIPLPENRVKLFVLSHAKRGDWKLVPKYVIGAEVH